MNKNRLQECIQDLEYVLKEWDYWCNASRDARIADVRTKRGVFDVEQGLCINVLDLHIPSDIRDGMFEDWVGYSGNASYPVGGEEEYEEDSEGNLYLNPKRRELAEYCLLYLREYLESEDLD